MYLKANPGRARSVQDREETRKTYSPGENVLPKIRPKKESSEELEDRRIVDEAREMSLREVGIRGPGSYERGVRHSTQGTGRNARDGSAAQHRSNHIDRRHTDEHSPSADSVANHARQIEHQSSLRSLLSNSDLDSSGMQEELMRQIREEGLLDGIDLENIDESQEDELTEKIADAYRRRHGHRPRSRNDGAVESRSSTSRGVEANPGNRQQHRSGRSSNPTSSPTQSSHPPVSRPHLLEAYPTGQSHRRRTSSQSRRQTSPVPPSASRSSAETERPAVRSATDLSDRPSSSGNTRPRTRESSSHRVKTSNTDHLHPERALRDRRASGDSTRSPNRRLDEPLAATVTQTPPSAATPSSMELEESRTLDSRSQRRPHRLPDESQTSTAVAVPNSPSQPQTPTFLEPSISCDRCKRPNIQYELYQNCNQCNDGNYNLCLRCYRLGRGCLNWYGFGYGALQRYERQKPLEGYPPEHQLPHRLTSHCYRKPSAESRQPAASEGTKFSTISDPTKRLQSGPFCSNCSSFAPNCYWRCELCNEGEWGYCNTCVNQGRCCTHALFPVALTSYLNSHHSPPSSPSHQATSTSFTAASISPTTLRHLYDADPLTHDSYTPLDFSTNCDICTYPIPPSTTRFHCPQCQEGDYDICSNCYLKLAKRGTISANNGHKGWRRCPNGHRMVIVGFEDSAKGQRRIVVDDLVGGQALKEDINTSNAKASNTEWTWPDKDHRQGAKASKLVATRSTPAVNTSANESPASVPPLFKKYPPNGGVGMRVQASWSYWPEEGANDELAFPRGAEIRECDDINGDWFWGIYCARKGLFPGNYGRVLEEIKG